MFKIINLFFKSFYNIFLVWSSHGTDGIDVHHTHLCDLSKLWSSCLIISMTKFTSSWALLRSSSRRLNTVSIFTLKNPILWLVQTSSTTSVLTQQNPISWLVPRPNIMSVFTSKTQSHDWYKGTQQNPISWLVQRSNNTSIFTW